MEAVPNPADLRPTFTPVADHAVLVTFGTEINDATSASVLALDRVLAGNPPKGVLEWVPALVNLLVAFDPLVTDHRQVQVEIQILLKDRVIPQPESQCHEVEVCYDEEFAPDAEAVAAATGLSIEQVFSYHSRGEYRVRMYGFAPGYAYLSGVPDAMQVPRKLTAVRAIPAGSVLVAGPQCLVTTLTMPSGWSVIGRSPTRILRLDDDTPFLFSVGDRVRFKRIDRPLFERRVSIA